MWHVPVTYAGVAERMVALVSSGAQAGRNDAGSVRQRVQMTLQ